MYLSASSGYQCKAVGGYPCARRPSRRVCHLWLMCVLVCIPVPLVCVHASLSWSHSTCIFHERHGGGPTVTAHSLLLAYGGATYTRACSIAALLAWGRVNNHGGTIEYGPCLGRRCASRTSVQRSLQVKACGVACIEGVPPCADVFDTSAKHARAMGRGLVFPEVAAAERNASHLPHTHTHARTTQRTSHISMAWIPRVPHGGCCEERAGN